MQFPGNIGERAIKDVVAEHPEVGAVLQKYDIGCLTCGVGICLLKDVVGIHGLGKDVEQRIEAEIAAELGAESQGQSAGRKEH